MKIYLKAIQAFYTEATDLDFGWACRCHGVGKYSYFVITERAFILAREIPASCDAVEMCDRMEVSRRCENLHVTLAVGDLTELVAMIPEHIKTLTFQKRGYEVHGVEVSRLRRFLGTRKGG